MVTRTASADVMHPLHARQSATDTVAFAFGFIFVLSSFLVPPAVVMSVFIVVVVVVVVVMFVSISSSNA